ncbi:uncharacterized protein [Antedon mediterranea]|uniref:uncharacterized protein n=1 Tax=Antedon mediterranea TaxID=105859 RepID=UPI003AF9496C
MSMSTEKETPRSLIQGFLLTNEISQSVINTRSRSRRSSQQLTKEVLNNSKGRASTSTGSQVSPKKQTFSSERHSRRKHSTPKKLTPEVSAKAAVRNRFRRSKGGAEQFPVVGFGGDDPTPRGLIQGFLAEAAPETPAVHQTETSPPTESFALPGIYNDQEFETYQQSRALSPLVDAEVVTRSGTRSVKKKRKRPELDYENFFSGIEKRIKTVGPRLEEDAAAELDKDKSTLEERAETDVILSSSPDASGTPLSRIHLQPDEKIPDFKMSDDESISGDESIDGMADVPREVDVNSTGDRMMEEDIAREDQEKEDTIGSVERGQTDSVESSVERDIQDGNQPTEGCERSPEPEEVVDNSMQQSNWINESNLERQTLNETNEFRNLQTPHISPRSRQTPILTERRKSVQVKRSTAIIPKTTTRKPREARKTKLQPPLPTSLTKSIFSHFSVAKVSKDALDAIEKGSEKFFKRVTADLGAYCKHSHRQTIEMADVELLMKRQGLITNKQSIQSLIEQHLPMEYRKELIPVAYSGNVVKPKM